jgi:hypothetical protein
MIAGAILAVAGVWIAIASDVFVMNGSDVVGLRGGALAWSSLGLALVGVLAFAGGVLAGLAAWIGALLNTWQVDSKAWFVGLLLLGVFNLGFFAMIVYLIAGPDGRAAGAARTAPAPAGA